METPLTRPDGEGGEGGGGKEKEGKGERGRKRESEGVTREKQSYPFLDRRQAYQLCQSQSKFSKKTLAK